MKINLNNLTLSGIRPASAGVHDEDRFVGTFTSQGGERCELPLEKEHVNELSRSQPWGSKVNLTVEIDARSR